MVGIKEVAERAGVSVGTVSNVLNKPESVSEARRRQVLAVIEELGYVPNEAARTLKSRVSRTVGSVLVDTRNPFYGAVAYAAEQQAADSGLGMLVANSYGIKGKEEFYATQFEQQRVRGILVAPVSGGLQRHSGILERGTPVILVDAVEGAEGFCSVASDDFRGGYLAVQHLIERGRRRILVVGGPEGFAQVSKRMAGADQAAAESDGVQLCYVAPAEMSILAGRELGLQVLEGSAGEIPDAIFAMNDLLCFGLLQALVLNSGIRVPEDIALIGYDDIPLCADAVVPLSSVRQPSVAMGVAALQMLEDEILEGKKHQHSRVVLEPELVIRASSGGE